jgi:hypothetical protein
MIIKVTNSSDSVDKKGSLRWAIDQANEHAKINSSAELSIVEISQEVKKIKIGSEFLISSNVKIYAKSPLEIIPKSGVKTRHFHIITSNDSESNQLFILDSSVASIKLSGGSNSSNDAGGGSIFIEQTPHKLILNNIVIEGNSAVSGGGIRTAGDIYASKSQIIKNIASEQGGGIWCSGSITLNESNVDENLVSGLSDTNFAGGINIDAGDLIMNRSSINKNRITYSLDKGIGGSAGGLNLGSGSLNMSESSIDENEAYSSGGIQLGKGNINMMKSSSASYNKSYISGDACGGGGIVITAGNVTIQDSTISHNETRGMYSGSIVSFIGNVSVFGSTIAHNVNRGPGGGIAANFNSSVIVDNSKIIGNIGASLGGAIINFSSVLGQITVNNSTVSNNILTNYQTVGQTIGAFLKVILGVVSQMSSISESNTTSAADLKQVLEELIKLAKATDEELKHQTSNGIFSEVRYLTGGGAIASLLGCPIVVSGGSKINQNYATKYVTKTNNKFMGFGGAIFSPNANITINDSDISSNVSTTGGCAIYNGKSLVMNNSRVVKNTIEKNDHEPSGVEFNGTIYSKDSASLVLNDCVMKNNQVIDGGGAIYQGVISLINSEITKNKAKIGGGLYLTSGDNLVKINSLIANNEPNDIYIK